MSHVEAIFWGIIGLIVLIWLARRTAQERRRQALHERIAEDRRRAECDDTIRYFANVHGYLARLVVSKDELQEQIDCGISPQELASFIEFRMTEVEGLHLGNQDDLGELMPVILPAQVRDKHLYVVGKSGYGKTNFLRHLILQDLAAGNGVGVLAPEIEMIQEELLPHIPAERLDQVVYFNPADLECPVVLNPLNLEVGVDIDLQVDETFTILQRVVGEGGPRMDEILRHSLYALTERPGSTLLDFAPLLDRKDDSLREEIIHDSSDDRTRQFFASTYLQMPKDAHLPILNRVGRFVRAKYIRNCLCPPANTSLGSDQVSSRLLNIRRCMDDGKILLFNLSDGLLGEAASQLIGQLIVSKFQTATMSRADTAKHSRRPFYLYLDEFQNFCGVASRSYERMLSRARKYGLGLILAHQQTGQIPQELLREILGNVSTLVSFQLSQADALRMSKEFSTQIDFEMVPIRSDEFLRLGIGQAYVKIGRNAFPMQVPKVHDLRAADRVEQVIERSRTLHGIPRIASTKQSTEPIGRDDDPLADIDPEGIFD